MLVEYRIFDNLFIRAFLGDTASILLQGLTRWLGGRNDISFFHSILCWNIAVSSMRRQSSRIAAFLQTDDIWPAKSTEW